jgi:molecular chaperone GrpE
MTDITDPAKEPSASDHVLRDEAPDTENVGETPEIAGDGPDDPLAEAQATADENWAKYLRVVAEMENLRKRTRRDVENARKFGIERFAEEILGVADSLEMGLEAGAGASVESLLEGKAATLKLLLGTLEKFGVEVIDPEGEPFDPQIHEAMTMQPSDSAEPDSVIVVVQKGYQLNGRLLRPARVVVASEPDNGGENGSSQA